MSGQVSLKLLVNKETNKVVFAEAGKDFVDVLLSFLTMPLGTIARLMQEESEIGPVRVGCLSSLYDSVANLDKECLWTETCKAMLLRPRNSSEDYCRSLKLNIDDTEPTGHFLCSNHDECSSGLSTFRNGICHCGHSTTSVVWLPEHVYYKYKGFVNGGATFIITDDLVVIPNAMDAGLGLFQSCGVKCPSSVQTMTVNVTKTKVLDLLKCSLLSKSTLTDLFLVEKPWLQNSSFVPSVVGDSGDVQIKVKLVLRKSDGKILFAEGEEDFADFLLSFLTLPLGGVVRMLGGYSSVGSIDGLYKSIVDLNDDKYLTEKGLKSRLVDPGIAPQFQSNICKQMFPICEHATEYYYSECPFDYCTIVRNQFYKTDYYEYNKNFEKSKMYSRLTLVDPKSSEGSTNGYAKGPAMFMATDDLAVAPMTPISGLSLLSRLKIPLNDLEEKVVAIGIKEGLSILKASLTSSSALTHGLSPLLTVVKEEK
ncbi:tyrosine/DOPA decarboxylase [Spatholobus suberectus]|nr:tyrosine/DOPA decarboxylase [Spatholobus suberectus]